MGTLIVTALVVTGALVATYPLDGLFIYALGYLLGIVTSIIVYWLSKRDAIREAEQRDAEILRRQFQRFTEEQNDWRS